MRCPVCKNTAHIRTSRYLTNKTKEFYYQCQNIAKRLNFDYTILSANKISMSHPSVLFLHLACAHLCSIGLRSGE
ncbi:ogr/Delta-like zinc finger family protein [Arsenophonus endosymbiont of Bemisia tabaci]|uniref:ogr/Delta-like zinc finger family protein n=1 Tax=Arsenophonus endosymbiont of Bemisia tabaci TaxID=536059 RepID=UPI003B84B139